MYREITLTGAGLPKKMTYKPATDEQFIVKEVLIDECYNFNFRDSDIILNLGGNIGAFDIMAFDRVSKIITVEPTPYCIERLEHHIQLNNIKNVTLIKALV